MLDYGAILRNFNKSSTIHTYVRTYVRTYVLRYVLEFVPHNYCNIAIILRKFNNHGDVVVVLCLARSAGTLY